MDIEEGRLRFSFPEPQWKVIKFDDSPCYRNGIADLHPSKAVDFVAVFNQDLYLIEVKDFRGHRIESRERTETSLALEVGQKTRDTVAGLIGAYRNPTYQEQVAPYVQSLVKTTHTIRVILWLESDPDRPLPQRNSARASVLSAELKKRHRWLTTKAFVTNREGNILSDVGVTYLREE